MLERKEEVIDSKMKCFQPIDSSKILVFIKSTNMMFYHVPTADISSILSSDELCKLRI